MTNQEKIAQLVNELEELVLIDNPKVKFASFGEVAMLGNPNGYLRLGLELMKVGAFQNPSTINLDYLMDPESDFFIDHIETDEDWFNKLTT